MKRVINPETGEQVSVVGPLTRNGKVVLVQDMDGPTLDVVDEDQLIVEEQPDGR